MKIAVFSDIHGNYQALQSILKKIGNDYDKVIYLGDVVGLGPDSRLCYETIYNSNIIFLLGNHELYCSRGHEIESDMKGKKLSHHKYVLSEMKDLKIDDNGNNLRYDFVFNGYSFSFFHFFLKNEKYPFEHLDILENNNYKEIFNKEKSNFIFFGHHHAGMYDEINNKKFYGIGSSGCTKNNKTFFYSIDINEKVTIKKVNVIYDRIKLKNRFENTNYPEKEELRIKFFGI